MPHESVDVDSFPEKALDIVLKAVNASAGSFFLWDEFRKELVLKAVRGAYRNQVNKAHIKLREGILGWVGVKGTSVLVKDLHEDERFSPLKGPGRYRTSSFIALPLTLNNQLIGVINITERENFAPFNEDDYIKAQVLINPIAAIYFHLRLSSRLQQENNELQKEISRLKLVLKENEPLIGLGRLAANLTHELNNPLDAIRRYVNLALEKSLQDSLTKEYLIKAKKAIRRAIRVIRHLMHFSSSHKTIVRWIDIAALVDESLEALEDGAFSGVQIQKKIQDGTTLVHDHGFSIVLYNLLQNSCQAMSGRGTIFIKTRKEGNYLIIEIEDNGPGVPEHIQPHLFDAFFTTKNPGQGMGLGLTLCKETVERHGGKLEYDTGFKEGARFRIILPSKGKGENRN